jgi:hypothetical protein
MGLAAERHHGCSLQLTVTAAKLWPKCGHEAEDRNELHPSVRRAKPRRADTSPAMGHLASISVKCCRGGRT